WGGRCGLVLSGGLGAPAATLPMIRAGCRSIGYQVQAAGPMLSDASLMAVGRQPAGGCCHRLRPMATTAAAAASNACWSSGLGQVENFTATVSVGPCTKTFCP